MSEPATITLTLDLDGYLARHIGYDRDGDPVQQHTTLEDLVIGLVVDELVNRIVAQRGNWDSAVRERVNQMRDEVIVERVTPLIDEALAGAVQKTNRYGEPTSEPTTLRDVIVSEATDWLTKPARDGNYGRNSQTNIAKIISDEVGRAMTAELKSAVAAAKAEVTAAVQEKGAEMLAQTIAKMAGER